MLVSAPALCGCSAMISQPSAVGSATDVTAGAPGVTTLPGGAGKAILERACITCHDLEGLRLFQGYYDEELWRGVVVDMVRVGAEVTQDEIDVVAKYLAEHFGPEE